MTYVDPSEMLNIAEMIYVPRIAGEMGSRGVDTLKRLLLLIREVHLAITTERLTHGMSVVCATGKDDIPCLGGAYATFSDANALTAYFDGSSALTVQAIATGIRVWTQPLDDSPQFDFVGYRYEAPQEELFFTAASTYKVPKFAASPSAFGMAYFRELRSAIEYYGRSKVKNSACGILSGAWLDGNHLIFKPRPEIFMRRSLQDFLRARLREHSVVAVMPEQNVNETRPVDIKVTWGVFNRVALIEIKWLGRSAADGASMPTQTFSGARAREGAKQLADYLDLYHKEAPDEEVRGYLVVFDARRRGVRLPLSGRLEGAEAFYRNVEITFQESILARSDFEDPIRLFCEPASV